MFTLKYPRAFEQLGQLGYGFQPIELLKENRFVLIVKTSKEGILAAKINQEFKIYLIPDGANSNGSLGFISAFFDDYDEPLVLYTPLYSGDELLSDLVSTLSQSTFHLYFFDEHDRELMGIEAYIHNIEEFKESIKSSAFRKFNQKELKDILELMNDWFSKRTDSDDKNAFIIKFKKLLYPDDIFIIETRPEINSFHGARDKPSFTTLERNEPGEFQEHDLARMLNRIFPDDSIFLNPYRVDTEKELTDVLCVWQKFVLIIQAKDSPNNEPTIHRTIERKHAIIRSHIKKGTAQLKGTISYVKSQKNLSINTVNGNTSIELKNSLPIGFVIVKELFDDDFSECSSPVLAIANNLEVPCLLFDYSSFHLLTLNCKIPEQFINAIRLIWLSALENGQFPRPRFLQPIT